MLVLKLRCLGDGAVGFPFFLFFGCGLASIAFLVSFLLVGIQQPLGALFAGVGSDVYRRVFGTRISCAVPASVGALSP